MSPSCNLISFFKSKTGIFSCDLEKETPDIRLEYEICEPGVTQFLEINFYSAILSLIEMSKNKNEIRLFKVYFNDWMEYVDSECPDGYTTETNCFSKLDSDVKFLLRIVEKNEMNFYLRDEDFDYEFEINDTLVFYRFGIQDPIVTFYSAQYVDITFMNGSNYRLNIDSNLVELACTDLAGQTIEARFVAEWLIGFDQVILINETIGVEISNF